MDKDEISKQFIKDYKRAQNNAVYFLEMYWNKQNPDAPLELTNEEKQELFDEYRGIPLVNDFGTYMKNEERIKKLKDEGYQDWEIM